MGVIAATVMAVVPRGRMWWAASAVAVGAGGAALVGAVTIGHGDVDVHDIVQRGTQMLLHGGNPYAHVLSSTGYAFSYGPPVLVLSIPGELVGDVRWMDAVAVVATVIVVLRMAKRRGWSSEKVMPLAVLGALFPLGPAMVHDAFTDVYLLLGVVLWLALRTQHPRWGMLCLAVALAIKPTVASALIPAALWLASARREIVAAVFGAAALVVPFAVAFGAQRMYHAVIGVELSRPPRGDTMSLQAILAALGRPFLPDWTWPAFTPVLAGPLLARRPRDWADLCAAAAVLSAAAVFFAKWAPINYWLLPTGLLIVAVVLEGVAVERQPRTTTAALEVEPAR